MIKAIVFDMGGVLLDLDMEKCKECFKEKAGFVTIDEYIDTYHQKGFWGELEGGLISDEEFIQKCIEKSAPGTTSETVIDCFREFIMGVKPEKVTLLKELAGKYPLYLLSNNNGIAMTVCEDLFKKVGFSLDIFTDCFLSYKMKCMKPGREIFERAIKGIGLPPQEILFIDDSVRNVEAAQTHGIKAVYYNPATDLRECVEKALTADQQGQE